MSLLPVWHILSSFIDANKMMRRLDLSQGLRSSKGKDLYNHTDGGVYRKNSEHPMEDGLHVYWECKVCRHKRLISLGYPGDPGFVILKDEGLHSTPEGQRCIFSDVDIINMKAETHVVDLVREGVGKRVAYDSVTRSLSDPSIVPVHYLTAGGIQFFHSFEHMRSRLQSATPKFLSLPSTLDELVIPPEYEMVLGYVDCGWQERKVSTVQSTDYGACHELLCGWNRKDFGFCYSRKSSSFVFSERGVYRWNIQNCSRRLS